MPFLIGSEANSEAAKAERAKFQAEADEVAKTVRRILYFLVLSCAYLVVILSVPDEKLVVAKSVIKVQPWNIGVRLSTLMQFAPAYLIGILVYIHLFLGRLDDLELRHGVRPPEIYLFTMTSTGSAWGSCFFFYIMVPVTLGWFTWKVLFRQDSQLLLLTTITMAWIFVALWLYREQRQGFRPTNMVFCAAWLVLLGTTTAYVGGLVAFGEKDALNRLRAVDLKNADLSLATLDGEILKYMNLTDADLSGASLKDTDLTEANLSGADLSGAKLIGANLTKATLNKANLHEATLDGVNFTDAKLQGANLNKVSGNSANFLKADLTGARMANATLIETRFTDSTLIGIDAAGTNFCRSEFNRAKLSHANFLNTNLRGVFFKGANLKCFNADYAEFDPTQYNFVDDNTVFSMTRLLHGDNTDPYNHDDPEHRKLCANQP